VSLRNTDVVDWLGLEKETGHIFLTVVDDEDWDNEQQHLEWLQEKLNRYLAFIESGEVFERLETEVGRTVEATTPIKVNILARYRVPPRAVEFLKYATDTFLGAGFALTHRVLATEA
jgi:hypothetical protein